jgi:lipopolysaccharide export LptBFGC system permease protein LptF
MVNEDILTALKNAIARGESMQLAAKVLINSGYNAKEVLEASKFIGAGSLHQIEPEETLVMPNEKGFMNKLKNKFSKIKSKKKLKKETNLELSELQNPIKGDFPKSSKIEETSKKIKQEVNREVENSKKSLNLSSIANENNEKISVKDFKTGNNIPKVSKKNKPKTKPKYTKEILLFIALVILVGILTSVVIFREKILSLFS